MWIFVRVNVCIIQSCRCVFATDDKQEAKLICLDISRTFENVTQRPDGQTIVHRDTGKAVIMAE